MASEVISGDSSPAGNLNKKELIAAHVKGKVKWFNVELGYGFINRDDTMEDVFVHHTAITKYNTRHQLSSLADDELVEFDVVKGKKGLEASNVTGPNGDQVKGSRFASNLYAGRFRFRRGFGNIGGRRFYSRRRQNGSRKESRTEDDVKHIDNEKHDKLDVAVIKDQSQAKKYSKFRKAIGDFGRIGQYHHVNGPMKRSSSLPSDLGRYANINFGRRRRRGIRGVVDGRPPVRGGMPGMKRRGGRRTSEKSQGKKIEDLEHHENLKSENEGKGENKPSKEISEVSKKSAGRRKPQEKSEKSEITTNEKSEKGQRSRDGRRFSHRSKKNSEATSEKIDSQSGPEDEKRQAKEDSGDGKEKSLSRGSGKYRPKKHRSSRSGGPTSGTEELSTQTPSTQTDESKSEREKHSLGGKGDGAKTDDTSASVTQDSSVNEVIVGTA